MSLKVGTSLKSHLSMICPQTTHFAILLSFVACRERVTNKGLRNAGKRRTALPGLPLLEAYRHASVVQNHYTPQRIKIPTVRLCPIQSSTAKI